MSITQKERDLYTTVWQSIDEYGKYSPGEKYLPLFLDMAMRDGEICPGCRERRTHGGGCCCGPGASLRGHVLDAGCGSGKGALALHGAGFRVSMCDLTPDGLVPVARAFPFREQVLWNQIDGAFDFAYCCDVLEHVPTQFTMLVAQRLLEVAPKVFIAVCNGPDNAGAWIGQPLHQTVQPFSWWRDNFKEIARVVDARDLHDNSVFLLERR